MAIEKDEPEPPPKVYGFKEREFKRDNALSGPPPPTAKEHALASGHVARPPRGASGGANRAADPNDPYAVLKHNRAKEKQFGFDEIEIKKIKSRKLRDYWISLIGGNIFIVGGVWLIGLNLVTLMFGLAGVIIFSLSLTWIMWQIVSKY